MGKYRNLSISVTCNNCGTDTTVNVNKLDYEKWSTMGTLAQNAFPYLTPSQRDVLIIGMCEECQRKLDESFMELEEFLEEE